MAAWVESHRDVNEEQEDADAAMGAVGPACLTPSSLFLDRGRAHAAGRKDDARDAIALVDWIRGRIRFHVSEKTRHHSDNDDACA